MAVHNRLGAGYKEEVYEDGSFQGKPGVYSSGREETMSSSQTCLIYDNL